MQTYTKIQLTQEQIAQIDAAKINYGGLDPVSSFGDKPIQVQIEGTSGETTYFMYGVMNEVFSLIPYDDVPTNTKNPKFPQNNDTYVGKGTNRGTSFTGGGAGAGRRFNMLDSGFRSQYKRLI